MLQIDVKQEHIPLGGTCKFSENPLVLTVSEVPCGAWLFRPVARDSSHVRVIA